MGVKVPNCRDCPMNQRGTIKNGEMVHDFCHHAAWADLELGRRLIKATERHKTSPKWCPKRKTTQGKTQKKVADPDAEYCKDCVYCGRPIIGNLRPCNYLNVTDKMRPCPAGRGCTVKVGLKRNWKTEWKKKGTKQDGYS